MPCFIFFPENFLQLCAARYFPAAGDGFRGLNLRVIPRGVNDSPFDETIYKALCACFGLTPNSTDASVLIREAYQEPENAPRPPRSTNVIYYSVNPDSAPEPPASYGMENAASASHTASVSTFAAWRLQIVCYGPHALENARKIRAFLYLDGSGYPRSILRKAGIYPVPDPPEPQLLLEPEGSLWRQRADLTVSLRSEEKETHPVRRGAVASAPAVVIRRG